MDNLELFLQGAPDTMITYTQKPNPAMNVPYELTVKGFKKFYLKLFVLYNITIIVYFKQ